MLKLKVDWLKSVKKCLSDFHRVKFLGLFVMMFYSTLSFSKVTLFSIDRINYKSYKTLNYDLNIDEKKCSFDTNKPFDIYYFRNDVKVFERIDMSDNSKDYFGAKNIKFEKEKLFFTFKAYEEFALAKKQNPNIEIELKNNGTSEKPLCMAYAKVVYNNESVVLKNITMKLELFLGIIIGIKHVIMKVHEVEKENVNSFVKNNVKENVTSNVKNNVKENVKDNIIEKVICLHGQCP
jgi:hypothetical protein